MKALSLAIALLLTSCASRFPSSEEKMEYSPEILTPVSFVENKSHLAMNVYFPPVEKLRQDLEIRLGFPLKNRGEAHITILTPQEVKALARHLNLETIHQIAIENKIQQQPFQPLCIGRGRTQIDGREELTFYLVVESEGLFNLRRAIKKSFVEAGGNPKAFNEQDFYPHITLGFTKRDLHIQDGIIKDSRSCLVLLRPAP